MQLTYPKGATPLDPDGIKALIPGLRTQKELDEFELLNIGEGLQWAKRSRKLRRALVSLDGIQTLHRKMFDRTWRWAGKFRLHETSIGAAWSTIPVRLKQACDDVIYWIEHGTYPLVETAVRFHHKLVQVHPFPNGNGRLGRLAADLLLEYRELPPLPWGRTSLVEDNKTRHVYIEALRSADGNRYARLLAFAVSGEDPAS